MRHDLVVRFFDTCLAFGHALGIRLHCDAGHEICRCESGKIIHALNQGYSRLLTFGALYVIGIMRWQ